MPHSAAVVVQELARAAGITQPIILVDSRGAERIETVVEKCDALATHSMKRTFVTMMRQRGVSVEALCKITGNSRRTIETYFVDTEEDAAREVRTAWSVRAIRDEEPVTANEEPSDLKLDWIDLNIIHHIPHKGRGLLIEFEETSENAPKVILIDQTLAPCTLQVAAPSSGLSLRCS